MKPLPTGKSLPMLLFQLFLPLSQKNFPISKVGPVEALAIFKSTLKSMHWELQARTGQWPIMAHWINLIFLLWKYGDVRQPNNLIYIIYKICLFLDHAFKYLSTITYITLLFLLYLLEQILLPTYLYLILFCYVLNMLWVQYVYTSVFAVI